MGRELRVGLVPFPDGALWLQSEEAIYRRSRELPIELVPVPDSVRLRAAEDRELERAADELLALQLDALIGWPWTDELAYQVLASGLPIIHLSATPIIHPLSVSPAGLGHAARILAAYVIDRMGDRGNVLVAGGFTRGDAQGNGSGRMQAIRDTFAGHPGIGLIHVPTAWSSDQAIPQLRSALLRLDRRFDAIIGLSDPLALAAAEAARSLDVGSCQTLVAGIGGDPQALAAIANGEMAATVALFPEEFGFQALELAYQAARHEPLPGHYEQRAELVTRENVVGAMARQLTTLARLPGWQRQVQEQRQEQLVGQLEASLDIICRIQSTLDSHRQLRNVVELICSEYGFHRARIYRWVERERRLFPIYPSSPSALDVWYDLLDGSGAQVLAGLPHQAAAGDDPSRPVPAADPGSVIIADGLGWVGEWFGVTGKASNSVVDQIATWATAESNAFAQDFEARYGMKPSPAAAGLSYDYAMMWIQLARQVTAESGVLSSRTLADFVWNSLLTGEWSYSGGCMMREYKYLPQSAPDPVVGPGSFTFSVLEYVDGEGIVIFPPEPAAQGATVDGRDAAREGQAAAEEPAAVFRLGVMGPFSGPNALIGSEMRGAVEMAFERANYRVGAYQIELVWIDCASDAEKAAQAYEAAIVEEGIQAGLLNWHTPVALACMELAAAYRIPHLFGLGGGSGVNKKWQADPARYFFWVKGWPEPGKLTGNYVDAIEHAIEKGLWQPRSKTAALWGEDTDWGRSFAAGMRQQLEAAGWQVLSESFFPLHETDFLPLLTKIKEVNPALLAGTASDPLTFTAFVSQANSLGLERTFSWSPANQPSIPLEEAGVLSRALLRNEAVQILSSPHTGRQAEAWPGSDGGARLVLPIRHGDRVLGLIDLQGRRGAWLSRLERMGLQVLADQLGLAMRDAELYGQAMRARALAEATGQTKMRLLADVSHELRTPLSVILGYAQRALSSFQPYHAELPGPILDDLEHIRRTSEHLLNVTDDLLDIARAEVQQLKVFPRVIDPRPVLVDTFRSTEHSASQPGRAVTWCLDLPERLPLVQVDPVRLRQIVFNLLHNATRFTDRGQITLGAEVSPAHLHFWVKDTGMGIPLERQERIFEPFVTAGYAGREREGAGLGLSIVQRLVALHNGSIRVESEPEKGTTFHVTLPLPSLPGDVSAGPRPSTRVLLFISGEHEPPPEIASLCQQHGLELRRLEAGDSLDQLVAETEPAALGWDLTYESADSETLLEELQRYPSLSRIPFIMYGGALSSSEAPVVSTAILPKPVDSNSLLQAIEMMQPCASGQILVVDDDPHTREYLARLISQACPGFEVEKAVDGEAALSNMAQRLPRLVILDLRMPGIDGFQVLEWMHDNEQASRVPVLVLTGQPLSPADIRRLERYSKVTIQTKDILSDDETAAALHRSLVGTDTLPPETSALVKRAIVFFQQHYDESLTRDKLAAALGVTENYFSRIFRRELGISPWEYLTRYRVRQAKRLLQSTTEPITTVAQLVGFQDPSYFGRVFRRETGMSPSDYRAAEE